MLACLSAVLANQRRAISNNLTVRLFGFMTIAANWSKHQFVFTFKCLVFSSSLFFKRVHNHFLFILLTVFPVRFFFFYFNFQLCVYVFFKVDVTLDFNVFLVYDGIFMYAIVLVHNGNTIVMIAKCLKHNVSTKHCRIAHDVTLLRTTHNGQLITCKNIQSTFYPRQNKIGL